MMQECFAYDDVLRRNGHFVGGEALQSVRTAQTLRRTAGKVLVTDGPFAETKERLGGLLVLEATTHAATTPPTPVGHLSPGHAGRAKSTSPLRTTGLESP
jgi:hypothetical protein